MDQVKKKSLLQLLGIFGGLAGTVWVATKLTKPSEGGSDGGMESPLVAIPPMAVVNADIPSWCRACYKLCSLAVINNSDSPVACSIALSRRFKGSSTDYLWTDWTPFEPDTWDDALSDYQPAQDLYHELTIVEEVLAPGETQVFSAVVANMIKKQTGTPDQQVRFVGLFGEVISQEFAMVET